ncbi:MAG: hypothetical protein KAK00_00945 [Nanoarchaeota archaeon]|nr:hypothetical protein [Nanoarchaeota archaeon]
MTDPTPRDKTNRHCPQQIKGKCRKTKKSCNNTSLFYEECNTYRGNKSLSVFL